MTGEWKVGQISNAGKTPAISRCPGAKSKPPLHGNPFLQKYKLPAAAYRKPLQISTILSKTYHHPSSHPCCITMDNLLAEGGRKALKSEENNLARWQGNQLTDENDSSLQQALGTMQPEQAGKPQPGIQELPHLQQNTSTNPWRCPKGQRKQAPVLKHCCCF